MPPESQIPIASQDTARRFATRLAVFYGTMFGMMGTHLPFFTVWLKAVGIDAFWIGVITAVPPVTRFTVLPFVTALAERRHISLAEAVLAWLLARSPVMLPIPGTTRVEHVESDIAAAGVRLTKHEMEQIG